MSPARLGTTPVPAARLAELRQQLSPQYGSSLWDDDGQRVLVIRVPQEEPDMVNDLERAVEFVEPANTRQLDQVLLLGARRAHAVPPSVLEPLMARRMAFDARQATALRQRLGDELPTLVYRDPQDPRKLTRLGVHIEAPTVGAVSDAQLDALADALGPDLDGRLAAVQAVHLVAAQDDVRLDPALFFQDLRDRFTSEERKRRLQAEKEARERRKEAEHRRLIHEMESRFRSVRAPVRRVSDLEPGRAGRADRSGHARALVQEAAVSAYGQVPEPGSALVQETVTESVIQTGRRRATPDREEPRGDERPQEQGRDATGESTRPAGWHKLLERLASHGFEALVEPGVPGHRVDIAAERDDGYPARMIAIFPPRLTRAVADELLRTSRELGVDLAVAVCEAVDPEARNRLVATKAKWIAPHDIDHLGL
ncbi:MAG: hypothetical protein ACPGQL_00700 [Thermoplasmatota archaeon]